MHIIVSHTFEGRGGGGSRNPLVGKTLQLYLQDGTCPSCLGQSNCMRDHDITCMRHGEIIARHNNIGDAIFEEARSTNLAPRKEEAALIPSTTCSLLNLMS